MLTPAKIHTDNIKDRSDAYLCTALVNIYTDGNIEYMALIEDGSKPRPYIDRQTLAVIWPPGRSKTIIRTATSWRDALEQLQAIADEYGTLAGGVFAVPLVYTTGDLNDDICPAILEPGKTPFGKKPAYIYRPQQPNRGAADMIPTTRGAY